jgi:predicted PurR-regulated permease PerM
VYLPPALTIFSQVVLGVLVGGLGVALAPPLVAAALMAVNMLYIQDVLGDKKTT